MRHLARATVAMITLTLLATAGGCGQLYSKKSPPPPMEFPMESPYAEVRTLAIAPAINLSGSRDFDPLVVSDILFAEMQQVRGLNVLPLNKTLMAMQRLGIRNIDDVKTAQKLVEMLGADGLVVPAVTAYDPYNPPTVGMILQMYTPRAAGAPALVALPVSQSNGQSTTVESAALVSAGQPVSQVTAVFQGSNQSVLHELRNYAAGRTDYGSALGPERYILDADAYMRFVCHAMTRRLMDVERSRGADR